MAREHARRYSAYSRDKSRELEKSASRLDRSIDNVKGKMEAYKSKSPMRADKSNSRSPMSKSPVRSKVTVSKSPIRGKEKMSKSPMRTTKSPMRDGSKSPKPKNAAMMSL